MTARFDRGSMSTHHLTNMSLPSHRSSGREERSSMSTSHLTNMTQSSRHTATRIESPSSRTDHLLPNAYGTPSRTADTRIGHMATHSFTTRDPDARTLYHTSTPLSTTTLVTTTTPAKTRSKHYVIFHDRTSSCWAKFVALLAIIFCCGLMAGSHRG